MTDEQLDQFSAAIIEAIHKVGLCHCAVVIILGEPKDGQIGEIRANRNCPPDVSAALARMYAYGVDSSSGSEKQ